MDDYLNISEWHSFTVESIFQIKKPEARSKNTYFDGDIPFVASGTYNNGVKGFVEKKDNEILDAGNCITLSPVDGSAFYQKEDFLGRGGAGSSILLLYNDDLNELNGLFVATILRKHLSKYQYNDMGNGSSIKKEKILLPSITSSENEQVPDWEGMSSFIESLLPIAEKRVNALKKFLK